MKVSVCVTVYNEEGSVAFLLESFFAQTKKPDEIVIVDGGSTDETPKIIKNYQRRHSNIFFFSKKSTRSEGRNFAVRKARNDIIAMTDAGCVADKNWIKYLMAPFENNDADVSAGFYKMTGRTALQKAFCVFLGVFPSEFNSDFLPSTRSMAFTKKAWKKVRGFPEGLGGAAEDTVFNFNLIRSGMKFVHVKNARVDWEMPMSLKEGILKIENYAKGDAQSGEWAHPVQGKISHNTKVILVYLRYFVGIIFFVFGFFNFLFHAYFIFFTSCYLVFAFVKVYRRINDLRAGFWGVVIQILSDIFVMKGFMEGIFGRIKKI